MDGLIVVDKPLGLSSMGVVRRVRRAAALGLPRPPQPTTQPHPGADSEGRLGNHCGDGGTSGGGGRKRKVKCGHAGTLDPLATGVVVCGLGKATKRMADVMGQTKIYEAVVDLSAFTATDDAEAPREPVDVATPPDRAAVEAACETFIGTISQVPPAYSAIHVAGQRAYKLVRRGEAVTLEPRDVVVHGIEVLGYAWPTVTLRITTGKGVYIRSIARDLGKALGTGGHLAALRRTAVGGFTLAMAHPIERFDAPLFAEDLLPIDTP